MVDGLALAHERTDQVIYLLKLFGGKVKAIAGIDQEGTVLFLGTSGIIKSFFKVAVVLFVARVA